MTESTEQPGLQRPARQRRPLWRQIAMISAMVLIVGWIGYEIVAASIGQADGAGSDHAGLVDWRGYSQQALAKAKGADQPVLLEFTADWCPPCQWMNKNVYSDPAVAKAIESNYVPIQLDASDRSRSDRRKMADWGVRGVPTLIMLNGEGEEIARAPGRVPKQALLDWLDQNVGNDQPAPADADG